MRAREFTKQGVTESIQHNSQDLKDVAEWMSTTPDKLNIVVKQEPIEKFIKQIREMYGTYDEFPEDEERTNRILKLLKRGANPLPMYVEANDPDLFVMEGRHRMVAFWLAGMKNIPIAYVSVKDQQGVAENFDKEAEEYRSYLLKTLPQIMRFLKGVRGAPSEKQMLDAIEIAYTVMKRTGDVKQAAKAKKEFLARIPDQQGVAEGSYREGGSITHDGVEYDFDRVMSIAEKLPTKTCSVDKLSWILKYDTPNKERLERADITVPLIVTKSSNSKLAAIDGLHRLAKAVRDNVKTLPVKYVSPKMLPSAKISKQGVAEGQDDNGISFQVQKGKNKFATTLSIGNKPVGVYQYDADTGRSIAEVYPEFKGKGLGKLLVLHAIYTAAQLGLDFQEDESRTAEYDNVLDSLSSNGYIVDDDGYWYVTGEGEQYLQQSMKQGVAEGLLDRFKKKTQQPEDPSYKEGWKLCDKDPSADPQHLFRKHGDGLDRGQFIKGFNDNAKSRGMRIHGDVRGDVDHSTLRYKEFKRDQGVAEGSEQQYLWHGSRQKIPMLEPRQSVDTGGAAGSNQNAIYATSDPKVAIAMGLTTPGSDTGMFPNDPQMVLFSGKIRKGENVYLHKLPMNGPDGKPQFVQGGNSREFHSVPGVKGIKPAEIKAVPVDKYLNLIRQATPQDLELRKKYMKQGVAEDTEQSQNTSDKKDIQNTQINRKPRQDLKHINRVLGDAGYKKLGSGAEAVVWAKRQGGVIKIIMPEDTHDATAAVRTFKKFYDFCQQHQDLENLPRFEEIKVGSHIETFTVDDREYTMIAMERLQPLKSGSMEEALVWMLSDFAVNGPTWEPVRKKLGKPSTWQHWSEPPSVKEIVKYVKSMDSEAELRWAVIYNLMRLLYHTGMINKLGWDLHTENVMQRKDGTLVIVDPWFALGTD